MRVAVAGGTGIVGRRTVEAVRDLGNEPVVLARSTGADLLTGEGLTAALAGAGAVIDTTNIATSRASAVAEFFATTTRNLIQAAQQAGVGHIVALSIVGIEKVPFGYYKGKLRQEAALRQSPVPVSILRTTQFHEFPGQYLDRAKGPVVIVPRWRVQPVAAWEVGIALASLAVKPPVPMSQLGGPREENMADLVRQVADARAARGRGGKRRVIEVRVPIAAVKAMATGGSLPGPDVPRGTQTFADWLGEQEEAGTL